MPIAYPRMPERILKEYYIQAPENTPEYVDAYFEYPEKLNLIAETMDSEVKAGFGDNVAILYEDEKITYKQLQERANKVGNTLRNLGIGHYDLVCLLSENRPEFIYIYCGIIKIGAIVCPFTPWLRADEIAFEANDSLAKALIVSNAFLGELEKAHGKFETVENIIVFGEEKEHLEEIGAISLDEHTQAASSELEAFNTHRDDVCMLLYSSGTTGLQKGTLHTHGNMVGSADSYNSKIQLKRGEVVGGAGTFAFAFPNIFHKLVPLRNGGTISITPFPPFDVEKLIINIERHNIAVLGNVP
ncbi:MAG: AMP-binding protein, partial [Thermodesulfobacteriota bacterium]|nr:AMP-binding protein [Thermodesulfobacteriota bacterium]